MLKNINLDAYFYFWLGGSNTLPGGSYKNSCGDIPGYGPYSKCTYSAPILQCGICQVSSAGGNPASLNMNNCGTFAAQNNFGTLNCESNNERQWQRQW